MYQYNRNGKRWYYDQGKWYASVTEFVKNSRPLSPHLIKWYKDNSAQDIDDTLATSSKYGTELHALLEDLLLYESLDVSQIQDERLLRHLTGINQFFVDYEVLTHSRREACEVGRLPCASHRHCRHCGLGGANQQRTRHH